MKKCKVPAPSFYREDISLSALWLPCLTDAMILFSPYRRWLEENARFTQPASWVGVVEKSFETRQGFPAQEWRMPPQERRASNESVLSVE